jgi:superoxide dismutase, Fe-Mn family
MDLQRQQDVPIDPAASGGLAGICLSSLGGDGQSMVPAMQLALVANFGSVERWRSGFAAMGKVLAAGRGWVVLSFLPREGTLVNQWWADPTEALAGGVPLLALDLHEDANHPDIAAAAAAQIDAFTAHIDWAPVYERYQHAVHDASETIGATPDALATAAVFDVRRAAVFDAAPTLIPGAHWRDPAAVGTWAAELPADREVVVYCVYGHEVGRATALRLRAQGVNARYLQGGIDGWLAAGRSVETKGGSS